MDNRLTSEQQKRNADNRDNWQRAEPHRRRATQLLSGAGQEPSDRLAVLGAGNLNDLDVPQLATAYAGIDLFDLDADAIRTGLLTQGVAADEVRCCAPCDLTGVWEGLASLSGGSEPLPTGLIESACHPSPPAGDRYQTVASMCLLSQLIDAAVTQLGAGDQRAIDLLFTIRDGHLRLMSDLLAPGGTGVLVTDFVSSETAPALPSLSPEDLPNELSRLINAGNFSTGLNPFAIAKRLGELGASLGIVIDSIECLPPWLWDFGPRVYAVTAITFQKAPLN